MKRVVPYLCCLLAGLSLSQAVYSSDLAFDPTRPSAYVAPKVVKKKAVKAAPKKSVARYLLQSVLVSETRRVATINNKVYSLGEKLEGGAKLIKIMPNYVEIERYSKKKKIPLFKTQIRQQ